MKVWELRELLELIPDYYEVGVEVVSADDVFVVPIQGQSPDRWDHVLALVAEKAKAPKRCSFV